MNKFVSAGWRNYLVIWLYGVAVAHLVAAVVMTWWGDSPYLLAYHQQVVANFGFDSRGSPQALALQQWWFRLLGATLQVFALCMLLLVELGRRYASPLIWLVLALGILLWAPQDMLISLERNMWAHCWVDLAAVAAIVPAAVMLALLDRKPIA